ncbi:corrinoid protein [Dehalobacter restrictus]|uniref:cobalamin B12-binding domain-containing protein n=1 Tax=Dehalobacter restrictus TaxID=55583 RepID=UPI00338E0509
MSKKILEQLTEAVSNGNDDLTKELVSQGIEAGLTPTEIINGMSPGAREAGRKFATGEYFLPELMMAGEAMNAGVQILIPYMTGDASPKSIGKVVIGSVEGDVHDIGKNIIAALLRADGFEVIDLGVDVPADTFIEAVKKEQPEILGIGSYMSTTLKGIEDTMDLLVKESLRDKVKVLMGGIAVFPQYVQRIGGDGYAEDADGAIREAKRLIGGE